MAMVLSRSRTHLDEDQNPVVFCHQIELTLGSAPIALQNSESTLF